MLLLCLMFEERKREREREGLFVLAFEILSLYFASDNKGSTVHTFNEHACEILLE